MTTLSCTNAIQAVNEAKTEGLKIPSLNEYDHAGNQIG